MQTFSCIVVCMTASTSPKISNSNVEKGIKRKNSKRRQISLRKSNSPKLTPKQKKLVVETREQLAKVINKYLITSYEDLVELNKRNDILVIDKMIITLIINASKKGDSANLDWLFALAVPKEPETKNINITGGLTNTNAVDLSKLDDDELMALQKVIGKGQGNDQQ